jgi:hypothetical protein
LSPVGQLVIRILVIGSKIKLFCCGKETRRKKCCKNEFYEFELEMIFRCRMGDMAHFNIAELLINLSDFWVLYRLLRVD